MKRTDLFTEDNQIAEEYDLFKLSVPHHDNFQEEIGIQILNFFNNQSQVKVIEIGCGTGITTKEILKVLPKSSITAIDLESVMLDQAKQKKGLSKVVFVKDHALSFLEKQKDNSVECIVSAYTLHNLTKNIRASIISEIYRVLKKDGIFINADKYGYDELEKHQDVFNKQIELFNVFKKSEYPELTKEWTEHYIKDNSEGLLFTEKEIVDLSKIIGFKEIHLVYREMLEGIFLLKK